MGSEMLRFTQHDKALLTAVRRKAPFPTPAGDHEGRPYISFGF